MAAENVNADVKLLVSEIPSFGGVQNIAYLILVALCLDKLVVPGGVHWQNIRHMRIVRQHVSAPIANARRDPSIGKKTPQSIKQRSNDKKITDVVIAKNKKGCWIPRRLPVRLNHPANQCYRRFYKFAFPSHAVCPSTFQNKDCFGLNK